jgi:hypothetical protein
MNKPKSELVMLRGPIMVKIDDKNFPYITVVKNDHKLDITGYEFTQMRNGIEEWTWAVVKEQII